MFAPEYHFKIIRYVFYYDLWITAHLEQTVILYQVIEIFGHEYAQTAVIEKAMNSFKICGIWHFNSNVFDDNKFVQLTVTVQCNLFNNQETPKTYTLAVK